MDRKIEDTCQLEICCFDLQSILFAEEAGIRQVELCLDYAHGGLWPGDDLLSAARNAYSGQLSVMIRPGPGQFVYSMAEIDLMRHQVLRAEALGADGCTIGALTSGGDIDLEGLDQLMRQSSAHLIWTCHRCIDLTGNMEENLASLADLGFHRVLTSGGPGRAIDHLDQLGELTRLMQHRLDVVAAGSIRSHQIDRIRAAGIRSIHSAASQRPDGQADRDEVNTLKWSWCRPSTNYPGE